MQVYSLYHEFLAGASPQKENGTIHKEFDIKITQAIYSDIRSMQYLQ